MKDFLKKNGWTNILLAVVFAIIGIFMIMNPDSANRVISYILGGCLIAIGAIKIINYFVVKGNTDFYNNDLLYGIIAIIVGLITIFYSSLIESVFRIVIGIWIIYSGLLRLSLSLKLHSAKINIWSTSLVLSVMMIIGGIYMICSNGALISIIGIIMLMYSIIDLIESIIFVKYVDKVLQ